MLTLEQQARLILAAAGGAVSIRPLDLVLTEEPDTDNPTKSSVIGVHFGYLDRNAIVLTFHRGWRNIEGDDEKEKVFSYLVSTFRLPSLVSEGGLSYEEAMHLFRVNESFIREHGTLTQYDLALIRRRQQAMQTALSNAPTDTPIPGDVVEGAYYSGKFRFEGGVIVSTPSWGFGVHFCACPYTPWLYVNDEGKPHINTSGGPFFSCDKVHFEPAGETERMFCEFGHDGPCGNGAVYFPVKVRCWKLKESAGI